MADPSAYTYPSPLAGYENAAPLPDEKAADGKSYVNPQTGVLSKSYEVFTVPLGKGTRGGLYVSKSFENDFTRLTTLSSDIHIYYFQKNPAQLLFARELWQRIRLECSSSSRFVF